MTTLTCGLTFVRHGETSYNKEGILQGQAIDSHLSDTGRQQAEAAGLYLKDVTFTNVYVSDMLRAQQTAEAILKQNNSCSDLQIKSYSLLKERSFGIAEGRQMNELEELAKAAGQSFLGFTPPGGETQEQVLERFKTFWEKMLQQIGEDHWDKQRENDTLSAVKGKDVPVHVLVVTHGALMCIAVKYFVEEFNCSIPQDSNKAHMLSLSPNTGVCRFMLKIEKANDKFSMIQIQCVFMHKADHLKSLN